MKDYIGIDYLGHSAVIVSCRDSIRIIIDPYITNNELCNKKIADIRGIEMVLVSHGSPDHMGDAIEIVKMNNSILVCDPSIAYYAMNEGISRNQIRIVVWGDTVEGKGVKIRIVESRHIAIIKSKEGYISGIPLGFIVSASSGMAIYHPGDTSLFSDMQLIGRLYKPLIGLIPVSGLKGYSAHMTIEEASIATRWLGLKYSIPIHYEKDSVLPLEYNNSMSKVSPETKVIKVNPGERVRFEKSTQKGFPRYRFVEIVGKRF